MRVGSLLPRTIDGCSNGTPTHVSQVGQACSFSGGKVCDATGACVACLQPSDCPAPANAPCVVATCSADHHCGTANAPPTTEWKFGVLAIDLAGSPKNTIVATNGVGVISTPDGPTLGYANARIVRLGTECRLVLQANDPTDIAAREELLRVLKSIPKACAA